MTHDEQMAEWVRILLAQRKTLYDFGWYLDHVPEPNDEWRVNK